MPANQEPLSSRPQPLKGEMGATAISMYERLGPGSLLWRYGGDRRIALTGLSAGILQLMHPEVGAGVAGHSNFFKEPWERIYRSIPQILGSIYDPDPVATATMVRDYHKHVKGCDDKGRYYHALHPETFWWTHAAFHTMVEDVIDNYSALKLNLGGRQQLYAETTEWWKNYQMTMRPVPPDYLAFKRKQDDIYSNVLEMTSTAERAIAMAVDRKIDRLPEFPGWIWSMMQLPASEGIRLVAIGGIPRAIREKFDIPWSRTIDEPRLRMVQEGVKKAWFMAPAGVRFYGRARRGNRAARLALAV